MDTQSVAYAPSATACRTIAPRVYCRGHYWEPYVQANKLAEAYRAELRWRPEWRDSIMNGDATDVIHLLSGVLDNILAPMQTV